MGGSVSNVVKAVVTGNGLIGGDVGKTTGNVASFVTGAKAADDIWNKQTQAPELNAPPAPGPMPTPDNSQPAMDDAAAKQRQAKGAYATIFRGAGGGSGLLSPGSAQSSRMMLGS